MIATAVLAADYAGTLDLLDTTTVRARMTQQVTSDQQQTPQALAGGCDLVTVASATAGLSDRRSAYALSYSASLTGTDDLNTDPQLDFLQFGSAVAAWHDRWTTFTVTEAASYGEVNSAYLTPVQGAPGQPTPPPTTVAAPVTLTIGSSFTDATLAERLGHASLLSLSASYIVEGGATSYSRLYLPEAYGPRASASFAADLSRRDTLTTQAIAQEVSTTGGCPPPFAPALQMMTPASLGPPAPFPPSLTQICHERVRDVQLDETLRRRVSPTATLSLGGGAALYEVRAPGVNNTVLYPVGLASLSNRFGIRGTSVLTVSAEVAPLVDVRTGLASERLQGIAELTDRITSLLTLHAAASALRSVSGNDPYPVYYLFTGSVDTIFRINRQVDFTVGAEGLWQDQKVYGILWSAFAYAALTLRAPPTHF